MTLGAHSEVGKLHKVMVHRPGLEHSRLTPSNAEELLFDDVLWVKRAKEEHDAFAEVMRERGVEVFLAETLLSEALVKPDAKSFIEEQVLGERNVGVGADDRAREWVETADPAEVADFLIGGITRQDVSQDLGLAWQSMDPTEMLLPPLPNFLFQRDPSCWIFGGVTINPMAKPARRPETVIMETIYRFHPMFAGGGVPHLARRGRAGLGPLHGRGRRRPAHRQRDRDDRHGGADDAAVRADHRPQPVRGRRGRPGARRPPGQVPQLHAPRHGADHVRPGPGHGVHPGGRSGPHVEHPPRRRRRASSSPRSSTCPWSTPWPQALGVAELRVVPTGGDQFGAEREQWDDGNNVVALEPGVVVAYERNTSTNTALRKAGHRGHHHRRAPSSAGDVAAPTA